MLSNGLNCFQILPDSNKFDSVMCACAMDVDFDGQNEIILGTYGQVRFARLDLRSINIAFC